MPNSTTLYTNDAVRNPSGGNSTTLSTHDPTTTQGGGAPPSGGNDWPILTGNRFRGRRFA